MDSTPQSITMQQVSRVYIFFLKIGLKCKLKEVENFEEILNKNYFEEAKGLAHQQVNFFYIPKKEKKQLVIKISRLLKILTLNIQ